MKIAFLACALVIFSSFGKTKMDKDVIYQDYVRLYAQLAVEEQKQYGIPASVTLAQALVETDGGQSILARRAKNHFGIKCKSNWDQASYFYIDDERNSLGEVIPSCFRVYDGVEESYRDHSLFLSQRKRYERLFTYDSKDYKSWCRGLKACGYATSDSYGEKLIECIERYNLYIYDQ